MARGTVMTARRAAALAAALAVAACCGGTDAPDPGRRQAAFSNPVGFYYASPTLVDGAIYVGTSRGFLYPAATTNAFYKLSAPSLAKVWQYDLGSSEVRGAATLDGAGNVYVVIETGRATGDVSGATHDLVSLDPTGAFRWSARIAAAGTVFNMGQSSPAISADGVIYVGGDALRAFDASGTLLWTYGAGLRIVNAPAIDAAGNVYFSAGPASASRVISVDPAGVERWTFASGWEALSSPAFSADESRIHVGLGYAVWCLATADGSPIWSFAPGGGSGLFRATPAVDAEGNVYVGTKDNAASVFYAIKADGSGLLWSNPIGADLYSSPALGNDGAVYFASEWTADGSRLHALDRATGQHLWKSELPADSTWSSPAIADDGTLYVATMAFGGGAPGAVVAFDTDSTGLLAGAGSPRFHGGNASTGRRWD